MMSDPKEPFEPGCLIELTNGQKVIVSEEDYAYLSQWRWGLNNRYAARNEQTTILMHRVIAERMGLNMAMRIKHKDKYPLNNRRTNLVQGGPMRREQ